VLPGILRHDRAEGADPHVEGNRRLLDSLVRQPIEQRLGEVQARRRRRHGPLPLGEHRLVALAVVGVIRPVDVRRQRHVTVLAHEEWDVDDRIKFQDAHPVLARGVSRAP
jgi:hypothetical protein